MIWHSSKVQPKCSPSPALIFKAPTIVRRFPLCPVNVTGCVQRDQPVIKTGKFSAPVARFNPGNKDKKAELGKFLLSQAGKQAVRAMYMAELGCELEAFKPPKAKAMAKKVAFDQRVQTIEFEKYPLEKYDRLELNRDAYRRSVRSWWLAQELAQKDFSMQLVLDRKWVERRLVPATAVVHYFQRALNSGGAERPRLVPLGARVA
eukprot:symbB.v1.2.035146.t1/scaffold4670.1/size36719/5